jgi:hypothetical protein
MEYLYRDGERQGSMGRAHGYLRQSIQNITDLSRLWYNAQKDARRTVAFLRMWV